MSANQTAVPSPRTDAFAFTIPEAVAVSKIGRSSLYDDIKAGKLEVRKRGSKTIILAAELVRYLNALPTAKEAA
jgi:hypothetical protein